jgi:hypothetical protein
MTLDAFLAHFTSVRPTGHARWTARCPSHDDRSCDTLSIGLGTAERRLIKCWAGCETTLVLADVGLTWRDLFDDEPAGSGPVRRRPLSFSEQITQDIRAEAKRLDRLYLPYYRIWLTSDLIREERRMADLLRAYATALDPDDERTWRIVEIASFFDRTADLTEYQQEQELVALRG